MKQLIYWLSLAVPRQRLLLGQYLQDMRARARLLPADKAGVLLAMADWLEEEAGKPGIPVL